MDVSRFVSEASFWTPVHRPRPLGVLLHAPALFWVVGAVGPRRVVQLGASPLSPYLHLCEAVERLGLGARCMVVDGHAPQSISGRTIVDEPSEWMDHDRAFGAFSNVVSVSPDRWLETFADDSIDLLLLGEPGRLDSIERELDRWARKLTDWGVVLLPGTRADRGGGQAGRLFQKLASRHPTFEFTHGDGFGLVAMGKHAPVGLGPLLDADAPLRDRIRLLYERLGRGLFDSLANHGDAAEVEGRDANRTLRRTIFQLREENAYLDERRRRLSDENVVLRQDNPFLLYNFNCHRHYHDVLRYRLEQYERSPFWPLVVAGRWFRETCFPESRLHGRCLVLAERFVRVVLTAGPLEAGRRTWNRTARKLQAVAGRRNREAADSAVPEYQSLDPGKRLDRFEDLPWMYTGGKNLEGARLRPTFKILLVGHTACRTGAPLCLLRVAEELSRLPDVECWAFVRSRGELTDEFARHVPTLDLQRLSDDRHSWEDAPRLIASRFRAFSRNGIALCNTTAVSEFHAALDLEEVPILSWIHELPTFIDVLVGETALETIVSTSRHLIVPANVVRDALARRFGADPSRIVAMNNGVEARSLGGSHDLMRARVREEFCLSDDALVVVGCGTIDLRKGADLFVQTVRRFMTDPATAHLAERTWFFWFGFPSDEPLRDWLVHDIQVAGLADRVRFVGVRNDMTPYFLGADVFMLTSREDPCPFANLEAMECALAVAAFERSGGAPDVLRDAGVLVPYLDAGAMAAAVGRLLDDPELRAALGRAGREIVRRDFTWARYMDGLVQVLRSRFGYRPRQDLKVSVIVPSHRHAPYLQERLQSIFKQTTRPHEIIFLDDASDDGSVEIARRLAPSSPAPMRIMVNDRNSGGTFRQWLKGIDAATGDLVWIAESDDCCHPEFLERLLPEFHDRNVALAYCQSALIDSNGDVLAEDFLGHTDDVDRDRWRAPYSCDAASEVERALSQKNTIPNASAVVFRRPERLDFAEELAEMRFAGDWLFYAMLIQGRGIAYVPSVLNYYRRHEQTVSHQAVRLDTHAEETLRVKARILETYPVTANTIAQSLGRSVAEYNLLTERYGLTRPALSSNSFAAVPLERIREVLSHRVGRLAESRVLFVIDAAETASGVDAALDLARVLSRDHQVFLCAAEPFQGPRAGAIAIDDRIVLLEGTLGRAPWSADDPFDDRRLAVLRELIQLHRIDVLHSRTPRAGRLARELNRGLDLPWIAYKIQPDRESIEGPGAADGRFTGLVVVHEAGETMANAPPGAALAGTRWLRIDAGHDVDRAAAMVVEDCSRRREPHERPAGARSLGPAHRPHSDATPRELP